MPLIVLSARSISGRTVTCETLEQIEGLSFPKIHVEGIQGTPSKSIWYRERSYEYGYPEISATLNLDCATHLGKAQYEPGETVSFEYPLAAYYFIDKPGNYSLHLEVHDPEETCDPNAKWLRTNTLQLEITPEHGTTKAVPFQGNDRSLMRFFGAWGIHALSFRAE